MKKYTDKNGRRVVEVDDLSYLVEREHPYNWFQRHFHHHRLRIALKKALFTSHDHQFVQSIADRIIEFRPDGVYDRKETYDEFLENNELLITK